MKIRTVPIEIVELEENSLHLLIRVCINDTEGDFIIDTGASVTVADNHLFPEAQKTEEEIHFRSGSINGEISDIRLVEVDRFEIGGQAVGLKRMAALDLNYVNDMYHKFLDRKVIGLLGGDFCVKHRAVIDCNRQTFSFCIRKD